MVSPGGEYQKAKRGLSPVGPMGVGAIFIATLAKLDLPLAAREAEDPQSQTELLAATIQPIVAFMVLCSVVCRKSRV